MKFNKILLLLLPFFFYGAAKNDDETNLGLPNYKTIMGLKNRQLIVVINEPNPEIVGKFDKKNKPEVVKQYEQILEAYNEDMKYYVTKFWNFNTGPVLYKTRKEVEEMMRDKSQIDKYYLMYCFSAITSYKKDFDWTINHSGEKLEGSPSELALGIYNVSPFYIRGVGTPIPDVENMGFLITTLNSSMNYIALHDEHATLGEMMEGNAKRTLSHKTLLIPENRLLGAKAHNDIGRNYPCNFNVVSDEDIKKAIVTGDSASAYIYQFSDYNYIVNCQDGAIMGFIKDNAYYGYKKDFFIKLAHFCNGDIKK